MFGLFKNLKVNQALMRFYDELKKNLELFYVHDQRQFIGKEFKVQEWAKVKTIKFLKDADRIHRYGDAIEGFNQFYRQFKEFEKWYSADMGNKSKENAQKLHTQRAELDSKLKDLYPVICQAGEQLEYKLIDLGLIKQ